MFGRVERVEWLTPRMVRVVLGGEGLDGFTVEQWTDSYVNLFFLPPDSPYSVPFDLQQARALPREQWPIPRRFTVRHWDGERRRLSIDFVTHGGTGVAAGWAHAARPGELLQLQGPSGAYCPDPDADWHLMIGDESALPAIGASLARVPVHAHATVLGLVDGVAGELPLACPGWLHLTWLHRDAHLGAENLLVRAVEDLEFPGGRVHAFVHGEAGETRAVRRHLLGKRQIPREALSVSPYWRRTYTDERWREIKQDWLREVEQDI